MKNKKTRCKHCEFPVSVSGIESHTERCELFTPVSTFIERWNNDPNYKRIAEFYPKATIGQVQGYRRWLDLNDVKMRKNVRSEPQSPGRNKKVNKERTNLDGTHCHVCKVNGRGCYPCELCVQDKDTAQRRRNEIFEAV